jgi:hypothetical protein
MLFGLPKYAKDSSHWGFRECETRGMDVHGIFVCGTMSISILPFFFPLALLLGLFVSAAGSTE